MVKLLLTFIIPYMAHAMPHITATSAQEVYQALQKQDFPKYKEETWIVFDLYHTLVNAKHPATHPQNMRAHKSWLKSQLKKLSNPQIEWVINASIDHEKGLLLTDAEFPKIIEKLEGEAQLAGLTTSLSGAFQNILDLQTWTVEALGALGISFFYSAPIIYESKLISSHKPKCPLFQQGGIFFTNGEYGLDKGGAIALMVKHVRTPPELIVMVDDKEKNLTSVQESLKTHYPNIRFIGILFKGKESSPIISLTAFQNYWARYIEQAKKNAA